MGTVSSAMSLLPLLSLATVALAAPPLAHFDNLILSRNASGSEPDAVYDGFDDFDGFDGSGSEAEDFANLTMSRAAEERAINTFRVMLGEHDHCKATSSFVLASAVHKHPKL